ncbi:serine hydrolase FSH [Ilyonectria sp. MPI-CAGE-AT-0026]|nr:serine hydrolase FSH [Ilyonectria sp. MPI-CAGE-AT-0026]
MKFLCLHGAGTNSSVLDIQTGPIRDAMGTNATFEFFDGFCEVEPVEEIKTIFAGPFYTWYSPGLGGKTLTEAKAELLDLIAVEGPFDACLGFSQGAAILAAVIIDHQAQNPYGPNLFRLAVFICGGSPLLVTKTLEKHDSDYQPTVDNMAALTEPWLGPYVPGHEPHPDEQWNIFKAQKLNDAGLAIRIPTAHIYGAKDHTVKESLNLRDMCDPRRRVEFDHGGKHEVPRATRIVQQMAMTIRRAVDKAMTAQ